MTRKEIQQIYEGMRRTRDEKIDAAIHAAFAEMGIAVADHYDAA